MTKDTTISIHNTCGNMYIIHTRVSFARFLRSMPHSQRMSVFSLFFWIWRIIRSVQFGIIVFSRSRAVCIESFGKQFFTNQFECKTRDISNEIALKYTVILTTSDRRFVWLVSILSNFINVRDIVLRPID